MRLLVRSFLQICAVLVAAGAWTFLIAVVIKPLHDRYGGMALSPTDADIMASIVALLLWITGAFLLAGRPSITLAAKIAMWLVLAPVVYCLTILHAVMRLP